VLFSAFTSDAPPYNALFAAWTHRAPVSFQIFTRARPWFAL